MRAASILFGLLLLATLPPSQGVATLEEPRPLIQKIEGLAVPTHAPIPETNVGIGPGAPIYINFPGESGTYICTANFVWTSGSKTYLGTAGHCLLPTDKSATHGPGADYDASGVVVRACIWGCSFGGASGSFLNGVLVDLGPVAYARQRTGNDQLGEDFGVVEIPPAVQNLVRPSLPVWGGPTSATQGNGFGPVCHYGNGLFVGESFATMARAGYGLGVLSDGSWQAAVPINSGDSGSAIVMCGQEGTSGFHGRQPLGIVTHGIGLVVVGVPGYGWGTTVDKAVAMGAQAGLSLQLVPAS